MINKLYLYALGAMIPPMWDEKSQLSKKRSSTISKSLRRKRTKHKKKLKKMRRK